MLRIFRTLPCLLRYQPARGQTPQCRRRQARLAARSGAPSRQRPPQSRSAQQRGANCAARSQFGIGGCFSEKWRPRRSSESYFPLMPSVPDLPVAVAHRRAVQEIVPLRIAFSRTCPFISTTALWRRFSRSSCARSSSSALPASRSQRTDQAASPPPRAAPSTPARRCSPLY